MIAVYWTPALTLSTFVIVLCNGRVVDRLQLNIFYEL
jgi:hypothetical protein